MKPKWYHGSPVKNITQFVVDQPRYDSLEGNGVYLTKSYGIARGYAGSEGSVYEVEVSGAILDMTNREELNRMVKMASKIVGFDVSQLALIPETLAEIISGRYQIGNHKGMGVGWQIKNILLNEESFISKPGADEQALLVENTINDYLHEHDAWLYEDTKLGLVMVIKNPDKVKPVQEIEVGSPEDEAFLD
jgi:hypothetical protein